MHVLKQRKSFFCRILFWAVKRNAKFIRLFSAVDYFFGGVGFYSEDLLAGFVCRAYLQDWLAKILRRTVWQYLLAGLQVFRYRYFPGFLIA
jgi:hypothetical protein